MLRTNQAAFAQNRRALERVVQLAHIAGPVVSEERLSGISRETRGWLPEGLGDVLQEASLKGRISARRSRSGAIWMSKTSRR